MANINVDIYLKRLKEFYKDDALSLERINKDIFSLEKARELSAFRQNIHGMRLLKEATERYKKSVRRLYSERELTDADRRLIFVDMDWALWYIAAVGGDPLKVEQSLEHELVEEMKRIGLPV